MSPRGHHLALIAALLFFTVPSREARAQSHAPLGTRSLGIVTSQPVATLAGAAPSKTAALGTVLVAWCERRLDTQVVRLGEWGLQSSRWLGTQTVRSVELCPRTLRLAWSKKRLVLVMGYDSAAITELVLLERNGATLTELHASTFTNAEAPSLDADEHVIALATYERRSPLVAQTTSPLVSPPQHALHVRLLDPETLGIAGARVFSGPHLLRPHASPEAAGHAVRLLGGRLYVAVADDDPRVVATRLPSLATERERTFPVPRGARTPSSSSIVLSRMGSSLVVGVGATYVLSPNLETVATHALPITQPIAFDAATRRVLSTDGAPATLDGWRVQVIDSFRRKQGPHSLEGEPLGVLFAHGRGVVFGSLVATPPGQDGTATWAIRLLP